MFTYVDDCIYRSLAAWIKRRHPNKNAAWWRKEYFRHHSDRNWVFSAQDPSNKAQWIDLLKMVRIPISRHVKIIAQATPFDERWCEYFEKREQQKRQRSIIQREMHRIRSGQKVKSNVTRQPG